MYPRGKEKRETHLVRDGDTIAFTERHEVCVDGSKVDTALLQSAEKHAR